ncbi:MAG: nitroreductase family protein [Candidatus Aminicenantes bacterium]|nr:nitroreductase family protein [Candidatus Aminicenantes bacterium]MDH5715021.1 nitroreductase family protein [Candidatus Aminicenantes bacterium]
MGFAKHREFLPIGQRVLVCCVAASLWLVAFSPFHHDLKWCEDKAAIVESQAKAEKLESIFDVIRHRRSVREYDSAPVLEEDIRLILDMAHYAPTAGNVQPWRFLIIKEKENLQRLHEALNEWWTDSVKKRNLPPEQEKEALERGRQYIQRLMTAPVFIFIFVDTSVYPELAMYDGCLAVENLMLAARALGYGTVFSTTFFPEEKVRDFVQAPANLALICATPLGRPKHWPTMPPKKDLDELIVRERFEKQ